MTVWPVCQSTKLAARQIGRDTRTLGGVAGAASGVASTWSCAQVGALFGVVAGPVGIVRHTNRLASRSEWPTMVPIISLAYQLG